MLTTSRFVAYESASCSFLASASSSIFENFLRSDSVILSQSACWSSSLIRPVVHLSASALNWLRP